MCFLILHEKYLRNKRKLPLNHTSQSIVMWKKIRKKTSFYILIYFKSVYSTCVSSRPERRNGDCHARDRLAIELGGAGRMAKRLLRLRLPRPLVEYRLVHAGARQARTSPEDLWCRAAVPPLVQRSHERSRGLYDVAAVAYSRKSILEFRTTFSKLFPIF